MVRFGFRVDKIYFWPVRLHFKQNYQVQVEYNPILPELCRTHAGFLLSGELARPFRWLIMIGYLRVDLPSY